MAPESRHPLLLENTPSIFFQKKWEKFEKVTLQQWLGARQHSCVFGTSPLQKNRKTQPPPEPKSNACYQWNDCCVFILSSSSYPKFT